MLFICQGGAFYECAKKQYINIYTALEQIGLETEATIEEVWAAIPTNSRLLIDSEHLSGTFPASGLTLEICKGEGRHRGFIMAYGKISTSGDYRMFLDNGSVYDALPDGVWHMLTYTDVTNLSDNNKQNEE